MYKKSNLLILLFISISTLTFSQKTKVCGFSDYLSEEQIQNLCGFNDNINGFRSDEDAELIIDAILDNVGIFRNFIIIECPNISNAYAATITSTLGHLENYIIYDKEFLDRMKGTTESDWSAISILAHEIGHHLNGHTILDGMDTNKQELQADSFSGFVLARLGASLEESLKAMNELRNDDDSNGYPTKYLRIKSISEGWKNGNKGDIKLEVASSIELYKFNKKKMNDFFKNALKEYENKNYSKAGNYFAEAFRFSSGTNKSYLNYAAASYLLNKDYDNGLKYYLLLLKNGINSLDEKKQLEVYRNITLIYASKNKQDNAIAFLEIAKKNNPNNAELNIIEANLQYDLGYKAYINGDLNSAKSYYSKAISLNPNFKSAYINLATLILTEEKTIINEMNSLGNSKSDDKRYEYLNKKRLDIYKTVIPYYEKVIEIDRNDKNILPSLLHIYKSLGDTKNYDRIRKLSVD